MSRKSGHSPVPALVETFPPIWQLPFAPRSRGIVKPWAPTWLSRCSRMHPAWHTSVPLTCANKNAYAEAWLALPFTGSVIA